MKARGAWTFRSFFICFAANAVLAGLLFLMADRVLDALNEWVAPFLASGAAALPEDARAAFSNLGGFLRMLRTNLAPGIAVVAGAGAFFMWLLLLIQGRVMIGRAERECEARIAARQAAQEYPAAEGEQAGPE